MSFGDFAGNKIFLHINTALDFKTRPEDLDILFLVDYYMNCIFFVPVKLASYLPKNYAQLYSCNLPVTWKISHIIAMYQCQGKAEKSVKSWWKHTYTTPPHTSLPTVTWKKQGFVYFFFLWISLMGPLHAAGFINCLWRRFTGPI